MAVISPKFRYDNPDFCGAKLESSVFLRFYVAWKELPTDGIRTTLSDAGLKVSLTEYYR